MEIEIGRQYSNDYEFMAKARLHQSKYRRDILKVNCDTYGNMLNDTDGVALLNYYDRLGVKEILRKRYPKYSKIRDANLLRSEHIPFNIFAPLISNHECAIQVLNDSFFGKIKEILKIDIEFAPAPKEAYLDDGTSFDTYIEYMDSNNAKCGYGIEVKYTEHEYPIKKREKTNIENDNSRYWEVTRNSGIFKPESLRKLTSDKMRQIWRNHILGISMVQNGKIEKFQTVTLFPEGNEHFKEEIPNYISLIKDEHKSSVISCTFDKFFGNIHGNEELQNWKRFLIERYIVT